MMTSNLRNKGIQYPQGRKKMIIKFVGIFIVCAGLLWLIGLSLWENDSSVFRAYDSEKLDNTDNIIASQQINLLKQDEVLHAHLDGLQKLDQAYALMITDNFNKNGLLEMNARISSAEASFNTCIDSIVKEKSSYPSQGDENLFVNMITSFRLALDNRHSINNIRNAISRDTTILNPDQKSMLSLKNELLDRDTKIANLKNEMKLMNTTTDYPVSASNNFGIKEMYLAKEKNIEKDNKIAALVEMNNKLQKEYDLLHKQVSEANKSNESNENTFKSRNVALENKIDKLNTELRLAQVDCNLMRADASQIISNSKQRRLLLSEASTILNDLVKTENGSSQSYQKEIQDKIARLNQVARNYRD